MKRIKEIYEQMVIGFMASAAGSNFLLGQNLLIYFKYRDIATIKYNSDDAWTKDNNGFSIFDAKKVCLAIEESQNENINAILKRLQSLKLSN